MVLLKEISEGIWGLALGPNNTSEVVTDHPFRLTMAALEIDVEESESTLSGITRVTLKSSTADKGPPTDLILCNLQYPSCLQQPLDIEIYDGQTVTFGVKGPHKVHLTGYVLQPEPQEMYEEGHLPLGKTGEYLEAPDESSDDDEDDDDEDDDDEEEDDHLHSARRHRLRDDEDQDLEGDYEDGYLEGEDQVTSESSTSDSDNDEQKKDAASSSKKRPREKSNGHPTKQEPKTKKAKKNTNPKEEPTSTEPKSTKKSAKKAVAAAATTSNDATSTSTTTDDKKKSNSLETHDFRVGNGPEAKFGKTVAVYYTGRLKSNNVTFDSCVKGKPFRFRLGAGEVIGGWDQGVKGMRVGGKRRLTIPPSLGYGSQRLPDIPPNSTLVFDVELKNVF